MPEYIGTTIGLVIGLILVGIATLYVIIQNIKIKKDIRETLESNGARDIVIIPSPEYNLLDDVYEYAVYDVSYTDRSGEKQYARFRTRSAFWNPLGLDYHWIEPPIYEPGNNDEKWIDKHLDEQRDQRDLLDRIDDDA